MQLNKTNRQAIHKDSQQESVMGKINDLSTISGVISELSNIHSFEKHERAIILFNCAYALLKQSGEYARDFDDHYRYEDYKYAFDLETDSLCEAFHGASIRLEDVMNMCRAIYKTDKQE